MADLSTPTHDGQSEQTAQSLITSILIFGPRPLSKSLQQGVAHRTSFRYMASKNCAN